MVLGLGYSQIRAASMDEAWNTGKTHIPSMLYVINVAAAAVIRQNTRVHLPLTPGAATLPARQSRDKIIDEGSKI